MRKLVLLLIVLIACTPQPLQVPYVKQSGPSCVEAAMAMALAYFNIGAFSTEELDELVGRTHKEWTWFSQALPVLHGLGLDVDYYSLSPYDKLTPEYVLEYYGPNIGSTINSVTDWDELYKSIDYLKNSPGYHPRLLTWEEIESAVNKGWLVILLIDSNVLYNGGGSFGGHAAVITGISGGTVTFHDSAKGPDQITTKEKMISAWSAKGTDNDAFIVKGRDQDFSRRPTPTKL